MNVIVSPKNIDFTKLSSRLNTAFQIAKTAHKGQIDKAGAEYINHPIYVASQLYPDESAMIVAILHDTVEDTEVTFDSLAELLTETELEALKLLTHDKHIAYMDYIQTISNNKLATSVKIADLRHNMDITRLPTPTEKDLKRVEKYKKAYDFLMRCSMQS